MRTYTHWLGYDGIKKTMVADKQYKELMRYLVENKGVKFEVYFRTDGDIFEKIIKIECAETYADLPLDCNSCSDKSLKHYNHKPKNIKLASVFTQQIKNEVAY